MAASLPYHEPSITEILTLSSFLLALNAVNAFLDKTLYCGLVGQVLLGVAWGTPGGGWLSADVERAVVQLGYVGLVLIVFEGGLSSSLSRMQSNLPLSVCVALTGVAAPLGLSFALLGPRLLGASPVQAFAAGAALCSTSLGTTFTVLGTSGLVGTRLGSVLTTAAMLDDVVGLVMVQVVASLGGGGGGGGGSFEAVTVVRPVLVSAAFAVVVPLACRCVLRPAMKYLTPMCVEEKKTRRASSLPLLRERHVAFVVHTCLLLALVVGASYAGASVLLAAYLAGITIAWWDAEVEAVGPSSSSSPSPTVVVDNSEPTGETTADSRRTLSTTASPEREPGSDGDDANALETDSATRQTRGGESRITGALVYEHYYSQTVEHILKPFFFASIGFSIPVSQMFSASILWRGIVYTILMIIGKLVCGAWLVRFPISLSTAGKGVTTRYHAFLSMIRRRGSASNKQQERVENVNTDDRRDDTREEAQQPPPPPQPSAPTTQPPIPPAKPLSLYPAGILSFAMVARGEIGFLISAIAESHGIFRSASEKQQQQQQQQEGGSETTTAATSELFLIVTWAIVLCTIVGPVCVGLLVKRIKRLEGRRGEAVGGDGRNVLGVWGVS